MMSAVMSRAKYYKKIKLLFVLERLNDADDDPSGGLASDESGADLENNLGRVEEGQKVFDVFPVDVGDDATDSLEGAVVDELDDVSNGRNELGDQK